MRIGELAWRAGLTASAIRYYEKQGLLDPPLRRGGQRHFPREAVSRVLLIRFARGMHFSLGEIRLFLSGLGDQVPLGGRWRRLARQKLREVERNIEHARQLKDLLEHLLACRCGSLEICVQRLQLNPLLRRAGRSPHRGSARRTEAR